MPSPFPPRGLLVAREGNFSASNLPNKQRGPLVNPSDRLGGNQNPLSKPEADRPIWQYRAGAVPKVRRRRRRGGAAWPRGRREAVAGGWTTGEAAAYAGPDGGRRLRRAGGWRRAKAPERRATARR
jgi:hypothetical protein